MEQHVNIYSNDIELAATWHLPVHRPEGDGKFPVIVICHGFVGNRIGVNRLFVKAARYFASQGIAVLRFDYEGCGESDGEYGTYGMERFLEQTRHVIDYVWTHPKIDQERFFLLGHSLGGAIAALTAARDERINKLLMWAAVGHPHRDLVRIVGEEEVEKLETQKAIDHLGYELQAEFFDSLIDYHPLKEVQAYAGDVFLAHGTDDEAIPVDTCFLYQHAFRLGSSHSFEKQVLFGADHTFSSVHASKQLFEATLGWVQKYTPPLEWLRNEAI
ncbi:alpha/beta hydrolase [Brevibacillus dissolubilis]|uniref:alpha/beta hydrolase n=1 Tax=Brevibacillus dissolubilis TaxID=1844116 RepID=UPI0011165167|nr:alpha/beta fold hydrolase [Brevibacillus dissolubilis]